MHLSRFLFDPGRLTATPGALAALSDSGQGATHFIQRHMCGDWGELSREDRAANTLALVTGERLLSSYRTRRGVKLWVITEADRSSTCILVPEEY